MFRKVTVRLCGNFSALRRLDAVRHFSVSRKCSQAAASGLDLSGVLPPIPTPFNSKGDVAYDKLEHNFRIWNDAPFKGYVVEGSNGEYVLLSDEERVELVKRTKALVPKDRLLLAGSGCSSTVATIDMTKRMADVGADGVMIVTPGYYRNAMNDAALIKFYEKVADASPVPVLLYSVPIYAGVDLSVQAVVKLSHHPNIIGLKDSGGDVGKMALMVHLTRQAHRNHSFQVLTGSVSVLVQAMSVGVVGAVSGLANILSKEVCRVFQLVKEGRWEEAADLNRHLIQPNAAVTSINGVPGLKAAMDQYGYYGGPPREPLLPVDGPTLEKILKAFADNGF